MPVTIELIRCAKDVTYTDSTPRVSGAAVRYVNMEKRTLGM
ncbi:MAG: hypothetical protein K0S79_219 [Nitrospira sp.]|jgi:hypothetical protein|nr:hypothetical protein [Nitrospira sp.]